MSKNKQLKIFVWSPMLSNVGTNTAMSGIAESLKKYLKSEVYYLDILGEFSNYNDGKNLYIKFLKINHLIPNTGKISKFFIVFFSMLCLPFLAFQIFKKKPDYIITGLVGFIPCLMKIFFPKLKLINSIQGYPKFNFFRKIIWKIFYSKSDFLITMTKKTKTEIISTLSISDKKIFVIENPVISRNIRILSKKEIKEEEKFLFDKDVYCAIGRLTHQKNFFELLKFIKKINTQNNNFNLIIIGEGEQKKLLQNYILNNELKNCFLLGFKKNPFNYLAKSKLYISTSLWEEPGHTLLEAGYLNVPILTSNCPNGPDEIIHNELNGLKYKLGDEGDFINKIDKFNSLSNSDKKRLSIGMKKTVLNYTQFRFCKKFSKVLN